MTAVADRPTTTPAPRGRPVAPGRVLVRGSAAHRGLQVAGLLLVVALLVWASTWPLFRMGQLTNVFVLAIAIAGLNLVTGYTGLLSIGHSAFFGLGAYTTGVLVVQYGFDAMLTVPVAIGFCFVAGLLVGLPSLRIHGLYLALVTLAVGVAFPELVRRFDDLTGGAAGLVIRARLLTPPEWTGISRAQRGIWLFWVSAIALVLVLLLVRNLTRSRAGLAMRAVRDHELAAAAQGVHVARVKILTFGLSAAITGLAGALFAMYVGALAPDGSFTLLKSIELVTGLVLGGAATLLGPVVGAVAVVFLPYLTSLVAPGPVSGIAFGVLLIALVFLMPEGVVGRAQIALRRVVTVVDADHPALARTARDPGGPPEPDGQQPGPPPSTDEDQPR
ncbi:branched-chain amino acid ABC transporter permease [Klenkia brasiliensis]|uniref:Amino acid/amide ABC transporter membrane protein 2, HAAT family (TC 3.A.1.4.-) n=1 Tax=Klenkia brasiliensis TaxID=333142 RepID=A0A1G8A3M5_9ACTN|nr:branched-chain amino acid ABC transporter permease [Klenkia brasiliensis]SDH15585.1 amino acid/amide ABC transporter membrane protein 2, HAAT family (TC 3.A.1.4.-) [Klenkia brasiliensis]